MSLIIPAFRGIPASVVNVTLPTYVMLFSHGDSRVVGVFTAEAGDVDIAGLSQYVAEDTNTPGAVAGGYPLTLGLTSDITPIQQAIAYNGTRYLSPLIGAAKRVLDDTGFSVDISGGGYNGQSVDGTGHTLGPLNDTVTSSNIIKAGNAFAARAAATPSASLVPVILTIDTTNDGGPDIASLHAAKLQQLIDLRTASGFSTAPIVVVSRTPEYNDTGEIGPFIEAAQRIAALKTANCYYCALPSGLGVLHEGQALSGDDIQLVRDAGYDHMGVSLLIALGQMTPRTPNFSLSNPVSVASESSTTFNLSQTCDQPIYFTGVTVGGSVVEISGDLEFADQILRPATGSTWPAYDAGTPANNLHTITLTYITGDRVEGELTFTLEIQEPSNVITLADTSRLVDNTGPVYMVAGKRYIGVTWSSVGLVIDGVDQPKIAGADQSLKMYEYVCTVTGDKTVANAGGGGSGILWIAEVTGMAFNGTTSTIVQGDRSGSFAGSALTGYAFAVVLSTGGAPTVNMTNIASPGPFYAYITDSDVTPSGNWSGYTSLCAIGLS